MRFLLDTHVWLWLMVDPRRIRPEVVDDLASVNNAVALSAASSWEITIKYQLGKLHLPEPPNIYIPDRMRRSGVVPLAIEHGHVIAVGELPELHRDPFDRLLVAQAVTLGMTLVTADHQVAQYPVEHILV